MSDFASTRTGAVMETVRRQITGRALAAGEKLPSIRRLASTLEVSPSTVVEAYERLAAEGLIRSRPGSGFYVCGAAAPFAVAEVAPRLDAAIDPLWVSRQSLDTDTGLLKPGCGWLPADWMPQAALRRAVRGLARAEGGVLTDYGSTAGSLPLRRLLARRFSEERLEVGPDQILVTASGTQAVDLIGRFLLQPGDTVLLDDPCYFNFQALLHAHRVKLVGVPYKPSGPDVAAFEQALQAHKPRLYITNSALHNPTGATLAPQTAHRLLTLAAACDLTIVEDDIFAEFEPEPSVRLAVLDGLSRVIRIGSFSKSLSASVRCGYIAAKPDWIEALVDLQVATNFGGPGLLAAELVFSVLSDGGYRRYMDELRRRLARARREAAGRLSELGVEPWLMPRGGFNLWCRLPEGLDAAKAARTARGQGLVLAPGDVFSVSQSASGFMRFNVAQMNDPAVLPAIGRALAAAG